MSLIFQLFQWWSSLTSWAQNSSNAWELLYTYIILHDLYIISQIPGVVLCLWDLTCLILDLLYGLQHNGKPTAAVNIVLEMDSDIFFDVII